MYALGLRIKQLFDDRVEELSAKSRGRPIERLADRSRVYLKLDFEAVGCSRAQAVAYLSS
jgi:hypothetical protein